MAATTTDGDTAVGPVPFTDICGAMPLPSAATPRPSDLRQWVRCFQGTWVPEYHVPGIVAVRESLAPRRGDVDLVTPPKCGTTWLKALAFASMARARPPGGAGHPLRRLNPYDCVPFMEMLFAAGCGVKMDALPSPRLMATHMQHSVLPASVTRNPGCKIIYMCRDPKDMIVSMFHFARKLAPDISFADEFEAACEGTNISGPIWDHLLG